VKLLWDSRQGVQRKENCDFLGVFNNKDYLVCFLIDAAERTPRSKVFVADSARYFIDSVSRLNFIDVDDLKQVLQAGFERLRRQYLNEVASYCCLFLNKKSGRVLSLSLGDCRVGCSRDFGCEIFWQNSIHTLANALGEPLTDELLKSPTRNVLTRALNAKRFEQPVVEQIQSDNVVYIATDGFWVADVLQNKCGDDASVLKIELCEEFFHFSSAVEAENYYVVDV
jgi:serine/threonine protein phosphatase PrpC